MYLAVSTANSPPQENGNVIDTLNIEVLLEDPAPVWKRAKVMNVVRVHEIMTLFDLLLEGAQEWQLCWRSQDQRANQRAMLHIDKVVVLTMMEDTTTFSETLVPSVYRAAISLHRGEPVQITASPYALVSPTAFTNCITTGVISNTFRRNSRESIVFRITHPRANDTDIDRCQVFAWNGRRSRD